MFCDIPCYGPSLIQLARRPEPDGESRHDVRAGVWLCLRSALTAFLVSSLGVAQSVAPAPAANGAPAAIQINNAITIAHLRSAPKLEDFETMTPQSPIAQSMTRVDGFVQRDPKDGQPATQKTVAYLAYTERDLYVVFVCFDKDVGGIRSHLTRRENIDDDDQVAVSLDTFSDKRRSYA